MDHATTGNDEVRAKRAALVDAIAAAQEAKAALDDRMIAIRPTLPEYAAYRVAFDKVKTARDAYDLAVSQYREIRRILDRE